jgi:Cytochrome c oxidase subunit IV
MSFVDRSNTNWTPFPRLAGIPQRLQVVGGIVTIFIGAGILHRISMKSGPPLPKTMSKEWKEATVKSYEGKEREAAGPVVLNPITRSREK